MPEQRDLQPEPDPEVPQQDELGRMPFQSDSQDLSVEDQPEAADPGQEAVDIQSQLEAGLESTEDDGDTLDAGELPGNDPEPFDSTVVPSFPEVTISDTNSVGFEDEFGGIDFAKDVGDEETPGRVPELEALDEAGKALDDFGKGVEAFHAGQAPEAEAPGDEAAQPGFPSDNALKDFLDTDYHEKDLSANILTEATRRIEEITLRLERSRL